MFIPKEITLNGKTFKTKFYAEVDDEMFKMIREEHYKKPDISLVRKQLEKVSKGGSATNYITKYFVKDLMEKTKKKKSKFSVEEVFSSKELLGFCLGTAQSNKKVYSNANIVRNIETVCRIGGKGCVSSATGFPIKAVDAIVQKYNTNGKVYDFSCGWGARMLGTIRNGLRYYGTDPNYILTERLQRMAKEYEEVTGEPVHAEIRAVGSEKYIPEWENMMGLAFSSPPYYDEEDYIIGNQSYKPGITYENWISHYLTPTIQNIHRYLTSDGFFCINVKDIVDHHLERDTVDAVTQNGFVLYSIETLSNNIRPHPTIKKVDNSERIYVFTKDRKGRGLDEQQI